MFLLIKLKIVGRNIKLKKSLKQELKRKRLLLFYWMVRS